MRRLLILSHRYLGIPLSVMFVVWFLSGIVMIYTEGFPTVTEAQRLSRLQPIAMHSVAVSPQEAWAQTGIPGGPSALILRTVLERPAWQFETYFGGTLIVFADTGEALYEVSSAAAANAAARYLGVSASSLNFIETLVAPDQWTLLQRGDLPLHRFVADDAAESQVYVSVATGDVALATTRTSRFFAWVGVIPHWLYFTGLRVNQPLWFRLIVVLSVLGCVLAAMGIALAFTQFRRSRPFSLRKSVRYRGGKRWHYFSGAIFGTFALTWAFSGLMSVEPFGGARGSGLFVPQAALTGDELQLSQFPFLGQGSDAVGALRDLRALEVEYSQILGAPHFIVTGLPGAVAADGKQQPPVTVIDARSLEVAQPVGSDDLLAAVREATEGVEIERVDLLEDYDSYYYSQHRSAPLPVLRLQFGDPLATWYYIDPLEAQIVARTNSGRRIQRWLFNGLHSLDFSFWYYRRPLWDIGMIALSLGALLTSAIGMYLGLRRLLPQRRRVRRST